MYCELVMILVLLDKCSITGPVCPIFIHRIYNIPKPATAAFLFIRGQVDFPLSALHRSPDFNHSFSTCFSLGIYPFQQGSSSRAIDIAAY